MRHWVEVERTGCLAWNSEDKDGQGNRLLRFSSTRVCRALAFTLKWFGFIALSFNPTQSFPAV